MLQQARDAHSPHIRCRLQLARPARYRSDDDAHAFTRFSIPLEPELAAAALEHRLDFKLAAGANHTLLLLRDENGADRSTYLFAAGSSKQGQLGRKSDHLAHTFEPVAVDELLAASDSDAVSYQKGIQAPCAVDVAVGWETSFILLRSAKSKDEQTAPSTLLAIGCNDYGQLAVQAPAGSAVMVALEGVTAIYSGPRHTMAQIGNTDGDSLVGWGSSRKGQLGSPSEAQSPATTWTPTPFRLDLSSSRSLEIVDVALGQAHTCMLFREANGLRRSLQLAWCGARTHGQIGSSADIASFMSPLPPGMLLKRVHATWNSTFILVESDSGGTRLYSLGNNRNGQLGRHTEDKASAVAGEVLFDGVRRRIVQLSTGSEHALALLEGGPPGYKKEIWGWGWNEHGNLGLQDDGQLEDVRLPRKLDLPDAHTYLGVAAGNGTSWIFALETD